MPQAIFHGSGNACVTLYPGDCREILADMPDRSAHLVLTDPPYFLDRLDDGWCPENIESSLRHADVIGGPMAFG